MKTKEELNALKNEVEALHKKLAELNADELEQVSGGNDQTFGLIPYGTLHPEAGVKNAAGAVASGGLHLIHEFSDWTKST